MKVVEAFRENIMSSKSKTTANYEVYTEVIPVTFCSDDEQVTKIMRLCGVPRALTYNKFGSLQGWGLHWQKANTVVKKILKPDDIDLPAKLFDWSVEDTMKAILAQQAAAKHYIIKKIYAHTQDPIERKRLLDLMHKEESNTTKNFLLKLFFFGFL